MTKLRSTGAKPSQQNRIHLDTKKQELMTINQRNKQINALTTIEKNDTLIDSYGRLF